MDLLDFFRGKYSWRKLQTLIGQLPAFSRYKLAIQNDEERAEQILEVLDQDEELRARDVSITEWSEFKEFERNIVNRLMLLEHTVAQVQSRKRIRQPKLIPGPLTALDRVERRRRDESMGELEKSLGVG